MQLKKTNNHTHHHPPKKSIYLANTLQLKAPHILPNMDVTSNCLRELRKNAFYCLAKNYTDISHIDHSSHIITRMVFIVRILPH